MLQEHFILFSIFISYFRNSHYLLTTHLNLQYHYLHHHLITKFMFRMAYSIDSISNIHSNNVILLKQVSFNQFMDRF